MKTASDNLQAVALNYFLEVAILSGFFIKKPDKIATSKGIYLNILVAEYQDKEL